MVAVAGFKSQLLIGSTNLSVYAKSMSSPYTVTLLDTSVCDGVGAKTFIVGQNTSTATAAGLLDPDATSGLLFDQVTTWTSTKPISYFPTGSTVGNPARIMSGLKTSFEPSAAESGLVEFKLAAQTDGITDFGVSLHALGAETVDGSAAAVDGAAASTTGGAAVLHVTAYSGLTSAAIIVEDSANGSTGWATIATFTSVTANTSERVVIAGTIRRYTRCTVDVTGTGSVTYACALARR